jgi:hypothetical protein
LPISCLSFTFSLTPLLSCHSRAHLSLLSVSCLPSPSMVLSTTGRHLLPSL